MPSGFIQKYKIIYLGVITFLYWLWESKAEGNIRIDLFFLYPILFMTYTKLLWKPLRWKAFLVSLLLMALNILFFIMSYSLFDKAPG
jgi:hypothetical protein